MKSVRISDEAYKKIIKRSKKDKRTITATIDILISKAIDSEERATTFNTSPYSPVDWDSESDTDVERKPVRRAEVEDMTEEAMTVDEMMQMSQSIRNNRYYNQAMSDDEGEE